MIMPAGAFLAMGPSIYVVHLAGRRRNADRAAQLMVNYQTVVFLPFSRAAKVSYLFLSVVGLTALWSWPVLAWLIPPDGSRSDSRLRLFAFVAPIFGLYFLGVLCSRLVRKRKEMGLGLGPDGIYYWTWFGCCFVAWDWIARINVASRTGPGAQLIAGEPLELPPNPEENWVARHFDRFRRKKHLINLGYLAVNPAIAYHALRFYHAHPEHRAELSTNAAVERIRQGNLLG
jgi:hypothetical protein